MFAYPAGLAGGSQSWGASAHVSGVAAGDVDGDGLDEIVMLRYVESRRKSPRIYVFDDADHGFDTLVQHGDWGASCTPTAVATGDIDGDRVDEILVGRRCGTRDARKKPRYFFYEYASGRFEQILAGGGSWGRSAYPTSIAAADLDGDGRDEVVVGRWKESKNPAYFIHDDRRSGFALLNEDGPNGSSWGEDNYVTSVTAGDLDGDGRAEIGIGRKTRGSAYKTQKFMFLEYLRHAPAGPHSMPSAFETLYVGGGTWGKNDYTTALAFGNIDGDPELEVGLARSAGPGHMRYVFMDNRYHFAKAHTLGGEAWPTDLEVSAIAFGDVDGDGVMEAGLTIKAENRQVDKVWILAFPEE